MRWYHRIQGKVYGGIGFESDSMTLDEYKSRLRNAYGSLRGVTVCEAMSKQDAEHKLLYRTDELF